MLNALLYQAKKKPKNKTNPHNFDLLVVCCLIISNFTGDGMNPSSSPSLTGLPIHQSSSNFYKQNDQKEFFLTQEGTSYRNTWSFDHHLTVTLYSQSKKHFKIIENHSRLMKSQLRY